MSKIDFGRENARLVENQVAGSVVRIATGDGVVVDVTGQSPSAGKVFFFDFSDSSARPVSGPLLKGPVTIDATDYIAGSIAIYPTPSLPTENTTLGATSVGDVLIFGGKVYFRTDVYDDAGQPIAAPAGESWAFRFDGTGVVSAPNGTAVTRFTGQVAGIKINP